jgi:hypothetical protein
MNYRGFEIGLPRQSGGKAGCGCNKTSTVQVLYRLDSESVLLIKQIRFKVIDVEGTRANIKQAIKKATDYVDSGAAAEKVKACGCCSKSHSLTG